MRQHWNDSGLRYGEQCSGSPHGEDGQGDCPLCGAAIPLTNEGDIWCWQCRTPSWVTRIDGYLRIVKVKKPDDLVEAEADLETDHDGRDGFYWEEDPDGAVYGICPVCGESVGVWLTGRCRCEVCRSQLVVQRHGSGRRFSSLYEWSESADLFNSTCGPIRTAYRDLL